MPSTLTDRIDGLTTSVAVKAPCRVRTTANITLSGEQTIDGVVLSENGNGVPPDRVLVMNQTTQTQNGIYEVSTSAWSRARDFDGARDIVKGTLVYVYSGTLYPDTFWRVTTADVVEIGIDNIAFALANNALAGVSAFVQTLLDDPNAAAFLTTLGVSAFIQTMLDDASASVARATLAAQSSTAIANSKVLGSGAAGAGSAYSELTLGTNLSMSGNTLNASGGISIITPQIFTSSGTYTPTSGMKYCIIEVLGGGGAGGGSIGNNQGFGGAYGGYARKVVSAATIGASQTVTIGAGGTGVSGASGNAGGTTSVGSIISATGGSGGPVGNSTTPLLGGIGSSGDINIRGASTPQGIFGIVIGSTGASGPYGAGAIGGSSANGSSASNNSGAGGGGSYAATFTGGAGGSGIVIITEFI